MNITETFMAERVAFGRYGFSMTRAETYAAYIEAGHTRRTADQFAFAWATLSDDPPHPNGYRAAVCALSDDHAGFCEALA